LARLERTRSDRDFNHERAHCHLQIIASASAYLERCYVCLAIVAPSVDLLL
jgi:hypothetical protein